MKLILSRTGISTLAAALAMLMMIPIDSSRAQQSLGIAAVVNENVISQYDLQTRINLLIGTTNQENTAENRKRHTGQVLNQLINERLQYQEAERLGVKISERDLERAYGNIARSSKMTPDKLTAYLANIGVEKEVLVDQLHAQNEKELGEMMLQAFNSVHAKSWGRVDFMLDKKNQPWLIEVNTVPGMTNHSLVPMAAKQAGINFEKLVVEILEETLD